MKVLIADNVSDKAVEVFNKFDGIEVDKKVGLSEEELIKIIPEYNGIIVRSGIKVTKNIIEAGTNLKVIGRAGIGVDNIDIDAATEKDIVVMNTPFGNINAAAEHTCAMILAASRHIGKAHMSMKSGNWDRKKFVGTEVGGKTLGVIGLGKVGKLVSKAMKGFGMKILGYDPFITKEQAEEMGVEKVEFNDLLKNSNYITVHVPKIPQTTNLLDKQQFEMMKGGVIIINVARGGIINENALAEALKSGKVAEAAIDVYENEPPHGKSPFIDLDNVLLTPHLGASTREAQINVAVQIAEQIGEYLTTGVAVNQLNKK